MGKIAELREGIRRIRRMTWEVLSDDSITYTIDVFGMHIKGKSIWIYALLPVLLVIAYIASAVSLYAFDTLLGVPEFSWINTVWWMIILATLQVVFKGGSD